MLYPKEDKENRILLYAVSAARRVFRDLPPSTQRGPALLPVPPRPLLV